MQLVLSRYYDVGEKVDLAASRVLMSNSASDDQSCRLIQQMKPVAFPSSYSDDTVLADVHTICSASAGDSWAIHHLTDFINSSWSWVCYKQQMPSQCHALKLLSMHDMHRNVVQSMHEGQAHLPTMITGCLCGVPERLCCCCGGAASPFVAGSL